MHVSGGVSGATALSGLSDVNISSPTNGQVPVYNNGTGKWENNTVSATNSAVYCYAVATDGANAAGAGEQDITFDGTGAFAESQTIRNSSNKKQLIIPTGKAGVYRITLQVQILTNATGGHYARVLVNGTEKKRVRINTAAGEHYQMTLVLVIALSAGDVITATANVPSGGYIIGNGYGGVSGTDISLAKIGD